MAGNSPTDSSAEITLGLLKAVECDEALTQRSAARDLGIALGLVNTYLKRCVKKGYVKVRQVPRNRYAYYLTPKGFAEKSRLTAEFLSQSLSLFRQAQSDYKTLFNQCGERGWTKVVLYGCSDLAEIVTLNASDSPVQIIGLVKTGRGNGIPEGVQVLSLEQAKDLADAFFITDLMDPQGAFDNLSKSVSVSQILCPALLEVAQNSEHRRTAR